MPPRRRVAASRAETLMRHLGWLVSATVIVALSGIAAADSPLDPATEARIKALEERVAQLENRLTAVTNAQKAAATAAATATPSPVTITPAQAAGQLTPPPVPSSVSLSRWKDPAAWSLVKV